MKSKIIAICCLTMALISCKNQICPVQPVPPKLSPVTVHCNFTRYIGNQDDNFAYFNSGDEIVIKVSQIALHAHTKGVCKILDYAWNFK